jgi:hypothetical protein
VKLNLADSVSSPQDLRAVIQELHEYGSWLAHNDIKERVGAKATGDKPALSPSAKTTLTSLGDTPVSSAAIDSLVSELKHFEQAADQLTITLAAPPTGAVKATLVAWCRQNISPELLVNFSFNSTLLGGMVIRHGSRLFDWSWRREILANRAKFTEVLRRV